MRIMSMPPLSCERCQIIFFYSSKIFSDMIEHFHDVSMLIPMAQELIDITMKFVQNSVLVSSFYKSSCMSLSVPVWNLSRVGGCQLSRHCPPPRPIYRVHFIGSFFNTNKIMISRTSNVHRYVYTETKTKQEQLPEQIAGKTKKSLNLKYMLCGYK